MMSFIYTVSDWVILADGGHCRWKFTSELSLSLELTVKYFLGVPRIIEVFTRIEVPYYLVQ